MSSDQAVGKLTEITQEGNQAADGGTESCGGKFHQNLWTAGEAFPSIWDTIVQVDSNRSEKARKMSSNTSLDIIRISTLLVSARSNPIIWWVCRKAVTMGPPQGAGRPEKLRQLYGPCYCWHLKRWPGEWGGLWRRLCFDLVRICSCELNPLSHET